MKSHYQKHEIQASELEMWQHMVDILAKIFEVPAGLIMRAEQEGIEVLVSSDSEGNPYKLGARSEYGNGLYCETVMKTASQLHVKNALQDENWKNNPDIKLNMISYLGVPLIWSDGEVFGTICVLDNKTREFSEKHESLLWSFKQFIEKEFFHKKKVEDEKSSLLMAVEQTMESVVITDPKGVISFVNASFERNTGYSREQITGDNVDILKSGEHNELCFSNMWKSLKSREPWCGEISIKSRDGTVTSNDTSISPVFDCDGNLVRYIGVIRNFKRK